MVFNDFIYHKPAKLALILNLIDPKLEGVLFIGEKGSGKSTLARAISSLLPEHILFVELPLNVTEDTLTGCTDLEAAVRSGSRVTQKGLLQRASGGILYVDDLNLLSADIVRLLFEPSSFILIATMNAEEGPVSPHLLDRFGLCYVFERVRDSRLRMRIAGRNLWGALRPDLHARQDSRLRERIENARRLLPAVKIPEALQAGRAFPEKEAAILGAGSSRANATLPWMPHYGWLHHGSYHGVGRSN